MSETGAGAVRTAVDLEERLSLDSRGLVPAVVQDATSREVLMLAWMNPESLRRTLRTGHATYWSRSRQEYWVKGQTSGNTQHVREVRLDCDGDTVLLVVDQTGPACHTGDSTCFDNDILLGSNNDRESYERDLDAQVQLDEAESDRDG